MSEEKKEIKWPIKDTYQKTLGCPYWYAPILKGWIPCVPEGTIISGNSTPIEKINPGDFVFSDDGFETKVTKTSIRKFSGNLVTLRALGVPDPISFTPEHPILIRKDGGVEWRDAKNLEKGDFLLVPRRKFIRISEVPIGTHRGQKIKWKKIDEDIAFFLGLWLAEGWTQKQKDGHVLVLLGLGKHEKNLINKTRSILREIGINSSTTLQATAVRIHVYNTVLGRFLRKHFGRKATEKRIPNLIKDLPRSLLRKFIEGYSAGDGCYVSLKGRIHGLYQIKTASRQLAYDLLEVLAKIGIWPAIQRSKTKPRTIEGRLITPTVKYWYDIKIRELAWKGIKPKYGKISYEIDEDYIYIPVKSVTKQPVSKISVRNLETRRGTYCLPFIVHNCRFPALKLAGVPPCDVCWRKMIYDILIKVKGGETK